MSSQHQPLPASWVDRLFARFSAAWGFQKTGVMFPVESHEAVRALWAEQLGRFQPESIRAALQAEIDSGREWPPTLPEFVEQCRQSALGRSTSAPLLAGPAPDRGAAAAQIRLIADKVAAVSRPPAGREWAQRILSRVASGDSVSPAVLAMAKAAAVPVADREPGSDDE